MNYKPLFQLFPLVSLFFWWKHIRLEKLITFHYIHTYIYKYLKIKESTVIVKGENRTVCVVSWLSDCRYLSQHTQFCDCMKYGQMEPWSQQSPWTQGGVPGSISVSGIGQPSLPTLILKTFTRKTPTQISKTGIDTYGILVWLLPLSTDFCSFVLVEQSDRTDGCSVWQDRWMFPWRWSSWKCLAGRESFHGATCTAGQAGLEWNYKGLQITRIV